VTALTFPQNHGPVNAVRTTTFADGTEDWDSQTQQPKTFPQEQLNALKPFAVCNASQYQATAIAYTDAGAFPGVNIELPGTGYSDGIHAEFFAVMNARAHGATKLNALDINSSPCGHCREFLSKPENGDLPIRYIDNTKAVKDSTLKTLLPDAFVLEGQGDLFSSKDSTYQPIVKRIHEINNIQAAVTLNTDTNYKGYCVEVASWNPSLTPAQDMLIKFYSDRGLDGLNALDIIKLNLTEEQGNSGISFKWNTMAIEEGLKQLKN